MKASDHALKPSTLYVRHFRERMRQQGLVKKDVWIRPEHAQELAVIEKALRDPRSGADSPLTPALE
ncbi:MAG: hypothetical protein ACTS5I_07930, partial [Rhodanobacter sp.]